MINWIAVIVAAVINMGVGFFWYGPMLFAKHWMKYTGRTMKDMENGKKDMGSSYGMMTLGALIMAYVLARFVGIAGATTFVSGALVGFWAWIGFIATFAVSGVLFEKRPWGLYWINVGYYLVVLVVTGGLLAVWR